MNNDRSNFNTRRQTGSMPAMRAVSPTPIAGTRGTPTHMSQNRKRNGKRAPLIVLTVAAGVLVLTYVGGVVAFSNICYPNTFIAGQDVSLMTREHAANRASASAASYKLTVAGDGFQWEYKPESIEDVFDADAAVEHIISANEPFAWPIRLANSLTQHEASVKTDSPVADGAETDLPATFDKTAFKNDLGAAVDEFNNGRTGTFDPAGAYDTESRKFTLDKAHSNRRLNKDAICKTALTALGMLSEKVELNAGSFDPYANGATDDQIQAACDAANALIGTNVSLKMGGTEVAKLDGSVLSQWITFDDKLNPTLSTDQVTAWVHNLALSTLDTIGSERTYTRPDGKTVTVAGGTYGWNSNEEELVKTLQTAITNKQTGDIEVPTLQTADKFAAKGQPDWGAYADVDLSEQHARYYDASGNLVWESGIITGNPNKGDATPTGIYMLNTNNGASVLIGEKDPKTGKPSYESPVSWWMPFVGNSIGFHDATWQADSSFSDPKAYLSVGSHGCINLPLEKAKQLAGIIKVGDCVIVHN